MVWHIPVVHQSKMEDRSKIDLSSSLEAAEEDLSPEEENISPEEESISPGEDNITPEDENVTAEESITPEASEEENAFHEEENISPEKSISHDEESILALEGGERLFIISARTTNSGNNIGKGV